MSHAGLDVQRAHVLPVLLQQRHEEVDGQVNVLHQLVLVHVDVSDGDGEAQHLLHLELDGGLDLVDLLGHRLAVRQQTGELAGLVQSGAQQPGNLLDQRLGGQEGVVLLRQLLHQLLVLVQLLQRLGVHERHFGRLRLVAMLLVAQDAHLHLWLRDVLQPGGEENEEQGLDLGNLLLGFSQEFGLSVEFNIPRPAVQGGASQDDHTKWLSGMTYSVILRP